MARDNYAKRSIKILGLERFDGRNKALYYRAYNIGLCESHVERIDPVYIDYLFKTIPLQICFYRM